MAVLEKQGVERRLVGFCPGGVALRTILTGEEELDRLSGLSKRAGYPAPLTRVAAWPQLLHRELFEDAVVLPPV